MGNSRDGVGSELPTHDAVDWFVENTADRESNIATILRWERWCSNHRNCAEYLNIVEMSRKVLPLLPSPRRPSQSALLADAASDHELGRDAAIRGKSSAHAPSASDLIRRPVKLSGNPQK